MTPGVTTRQEIIDFALSAEGGKNNPDAPDGHMNAGLFGPSGCFSILIEPVLGRPPLDADELLNLFAIVRREHSGIGETDQEPVAGEKTGG